MNKNQFEKSFKNQQLFYVSIRKFCFHRFLFTDGLKNKLLRKKYQYLQEKYPIPWVLYKIFEIFQNEIFAENLLLYQFWPARTFKITLLLIIFWLKLVKNLKKNIINAIFSNCLRKNHCYHYNWRCYTKRSRKKKLLIEYPTIRKG